MPHTPGPWHTTRNRPAVVTIETGRRVADCRSGNDEEGFDESNALLVAAAPDLLAACELAYRTFRRDREEEIDDREPEIEALSAALAKARGEAP